jgi:hypothetical protein
VHSDYPKLRLNRSIEVEEVDFVLRLMVDIVLGVLVIRYYIRERSDPCMSWQHVIDHSPSLSPSGLAYY